MRTPMHECMHASAPLSRRAHTYPLGPSIRTVVSVPATARVYIRTRGSEYAHCVTATMRGGACPDIAMGARLFVVEQRDHAHVGVVRQRGRIAAVRLPRPRGCVGAHTGVCVRARARTRSASNAVKQCT
jgi:hypothetical protein